MGTADEQRLRARMIGAGVWLSALLILAVGGWVAATWADPHRAVITMLDGAAAIVTAVVARLPRDRLVRSAGREWFFLGWSLSLIIFIALVAALDTGVRSPVVLLLFLTLVFAALSYPRWSVAVVTVSSLCAVAAVDASHMGPDQAVADRIYVLGLMLSLAVAGGLCMIQARIQQQARDELARISRRDPLTGALNRLGFAEHLARDLAGGVVDGRPVSLILVDFDAFKAVNDREGHAAGDALLVWSVSAMRTVLRPGDALARLGGDEFSVLLPATGSEAAGEIADRLRAAVSSRATISVGIACTPTDGVDSEVLHRQADRRLYEAKRALGPARHLLVPPAVAVA